MLEKSGNLLELSVKQLVINQGWQVGFPWFRLYLVCEKHFNVVCSKVRYFRIQQELFKSKSNLIPFKR